VRPSGPITGEVLVNGKTIACVSSSCASEPAAAGATVIDTKAIIFPGLLDAHNHAAFNLFDESDWAPGPHFKNHNSWTSEPRYKQVMAAKKYMESSSQGNVACEMDKYGEIKSILGGTTSVLVAPKLTARACFGSLARTIDTRFNDLGAGDTIQVSISVPSASGAKSICDAIDVTRRTKAYLVHVGEGVDETSRKEFTRLASRHGGCLLRKETTIIHGTAFELPHFQAMAAHDMGLVWSPKSNFFLYSRQDGQPPTTRIDLAMQAGVKTIALGPDWALGGSVNLLDELRFARKVAADSGWTAVTKERLFRMVTIDAAKALGVDGQLGSLTVGKRADILVLTGDTANPYAALSSATVKNVRLVMVDGKALHGEESMLPAAAFPECETRSVCGSIKFICAAEPDAAPATTLGQTLSQIEGKLNAALGQFEAAHAPAGGTVLPLAPLASCP
jgi:5-methylthioadenosine/S-adenosylhomocysteine deaminase